MIQKFCIYIRGKISMNAKIEIYCSLIKINCKSFKILINKIMIQKFCIYIGGKISTNAKIEIYYYLIKINCK